MFIYLLIAAELAVLYTVFWYLYLRQPRVSRRIKASMWGTYAEAMAEGQFDPLMPFAKTDDERQVAALLATYYDKGNRAVVPGELVLDSVTNRYVPIPQPQGLFTKVAVKLDDTFSQLNVRP